MLAHGKPHGCQLKPHDLPTHANLFCLPFTMWVGYPSMWLPTQFGLISYTVVRLPQFTDQPTNAKLLEDEFETGVRATKNDEGIVEGDEIKRCIELVMGDGEIGEEIKKNSKKWKYLAKEAVKEGGSSHKNLRTFVDEIDDGF
ncbi:hypothetical protein CsSME_00034199 [Camellia sinensis var. sinensis]